MILKSYSKLNLYLQVLNKRPDNFHSLFTIFERIDLCDEIILKPRRDNLIRIICKDPAVPVDQTNLCYRAADLLRKKFKLNKGVDIAIKKNIPVGAGLGGGSGNAACVLMGLNKLWKLDISKERLKGLAAKIGSDVAFFIYETPFAQGLGRGEKIRPIRVLKKTKLWHVLLVPKLHVSTPLIYNKFDLYSKLTPQKQSAKMLILALKKTHFLQVSENLFNSLEAITIRLYPKVQRAKFELEKLGVRAILMSGSGSAVFGIVTSRKEAFFLYRKLAKNKSLGRVFIARTV